MMAWVLVLVGALNWGLIGFFGFNLVNALLGSMPTAEKVAYDLVGLAAVAMLFKGRCKMCGRGSCDCGEGSGCACGMGEKKM